MFHNSFLCNAYAQKFNVMGYYHVSGNTPFSRVSLGLEIALILWKKVK